MISNLVQITASIQNPDKQAIQSKQIVDVSISIFDVSSSGYSNAMSLNYQNTEAVVYLDSTTTTGSLYYTPVYNENLNYEVWKQRVNKSFNELGIV